VIGPVNGEAITGAVIERATLTVELYRPEGRHTVVVDAPPEHPAVHALLRWHLERLAAQVATAPPSFGPIS
jgi:hypothetical protein